jgi:hypothetical protein
LTLFLAVERLWCWREEGLRLDDEDEVDEEEELVLLWEPVLEQKYLN